jgi:hypothetical protein
VSVRDPHLGRADRWSKYLESTSDRTVALIAAIASTLFVVTIAVAAFLIDVLSCIGESGPPHCQNGSTADLSLIFGTIAPVGIAGVVSAIGLRQRRPFLTLITAVPLAAVIIVLHFVVWW